MVPIDDAGDGQVDSREENDGDDIHSIEPSQKGCGQAAPTRRDT